jgi:hypothetical protein
MTSTVASTDKSAALRALLSEVPKPSAYTPTSDALTRAKELGEKQIADTLTRFLSMPQATMTLANPVLHRADVHCSGTDVELDIRSYSIRGIVEEHEIVNGALTAPGLIFAGLFGRRAATLEDGTPEEEVLCALIDRYFHRALALDSADGHAAQVARFVHRFPEGGPEIALQYFLALRRAELMAEGGHGDRGINTDRPPGKLLDDMIHEHMRSVASGCVSMLCNHRLRETPGLSADALVTAAVEFLRAEAAAGKSAFEIAYSCLLGRSASATENQILERMGMIQMHHGSAGSNMVARFLATLHCNSSLEFLAACQITLDSKRHFGAIHDMTALIRKLESSPEAQHAEIIRDEVLTGGLPTFGHPHISAASRGGSIQQDPRAAVYLSPVLDAIDKGALDLNESQRRRLGIIQRIYRTALVDGIVKPGREDDEPLRLTPNTDFGAWSVQEVLGIHDHDRTFLTYIFRAFGWMMDAREQLQMKIIRPVIAADPSIVPKAGDDTIPKLVVKLHNRLASDQPAFAKH